MAEKLLQEDGSSFVLQEDGSSGILLEAVQMSWMPVYPTVIKIEYVAVPSGQII